MKAQVYTPAQGRALVSAERARKEFWYYDNQRKCRVNYTQESKQAGDAETLRIFNGGSGTKKFAFTNLPFEIRAMVLGHHLVRPIVICPAEVLLEVKIGNQKLVVGVYSYEWATHIQMKKKIFDEAKLPRYDGCPQRLLIHELATPEKTGLEDVRLDGVYDTIADSFITKAVVGREWPMICTTSVIVTTGIQPNILRTCRDLYKEDYGSHAETSQICIYTLPLINFTQ